MLTMEINKMLCKNCEIEINNTARTCPKCGMDSLRQFELWPVGAAILSLIGCGQIYNGQIGKGIIFIFSMLIFLQLSPALAGLLWIYSIYDAYKTAKELKVILI